MSGVYRPRATTTVLAWRWLGENSEPMPIWLLMCASRVDVALFDDLSLSVSTAAAGSHCIEHGDWFVLEDKKLRSMSDREFVAAYEAAR